MGDKVCVWGEVVFDMGNLFMSLVCVLAFSTGFLPSTRSASRHLPPPPLIGGQTGPSRLGGGGDGVGLEVHGWLQLLLL